MGLEVIDSEIVNAIRRKDNQRLMRELVSSRGRVMTPSDVAPFFLVDAKTVTRWAMAGLIPYFKTPGGHTRFWEHDVVDALQDEMVANPLREFVEWLVSLNDVEQQDERRAISINDIINRARYALECRRVSLRARTDGTRTKEY